MEETENVTEQSGSCLNPSYAYNKLTMNVQSFRLFTLPNDIIDFTFYNLVVGFAADFFQFETSAMITRHDFIVNKPPETIKEKENLFYSFND